MSRPNEYRCPPPASRPLPSPGVPAERIPPLPSPSPSPLPPPSPAQKRFDEEDLPLEGDDEALSMKRRMTETADDIDCGSIENLIAVWYCHQDCIRKHFDFVERKFRLPDHDDCNAKCPSVCSPPPSPAMPPVAPPPSPTQPFPPPIPSLVPPSPSPPSPPPPSPSSPLPPPSPPLPPVPRCRAAGNVWPPRCRDAHAGRDYAEIIRDCPISWPTCLFTTTFQSC